MSARTSLQSPNVTHLYCKLRRDDVLTVGEAHRELCPLRIQISAPLCKVVCRDRLCLQQLIQHRQRWSHVWAGVGQGWNEEEATGMVGMAGGQGGEGSKGQRNGQWVMSLQTRAPCTTNCAAVHLHAFICSFFNAPAQMGMCAVLFLSISAGSMSMCTILDRVANASSRPVTRSSKRTPSAMSRSACV